MMTNDRHLHWQVNTRQTTLQTATTMYM